MIDHGGEDQFRIGNYRIYKAEMDAKHGNGYHQGPFEHQQQGPEKRQKARFPVRSGRQITLYHVSASSAPSFYHYLEKVKRQ